jgi:hypothetical protein
MNDDTIIRDRIAGKSVRAIAEAQRIPESAVNDAIDRWASSAITDRIRTPSLALELAWLDELREVYYRRALEGDARCAALVTQIIECRHSMLEREIAASAAQMKTDPATH